jgi:major vault protein
MNDSGRERDLVLAPNEYAFILDQTKGHINVYVGPFKTSLANTDRPVVFDENTKSFVRCNLEESVKLFSTAPEGWYVVLKNPAKDGNQPKLGTSNTLTELNVGRKVNIPGPISFALWPGQMARIVRGHHLRSNQYLLVRIYDEAEAQKNWNNAVITAKDDAALELPDLTMGKLLVITGQKASFYIPPTGVEVVRDEYDEYVREAVTLERLEYCILKDEDGNKRYVRGPAVVFPQPTEDFITDDNGSRKFKAIELNSIQGLYIKVIAPYSENGKQYQEGDELFITGADTAIYYPRAEHSIIKYGGRERHYAVVIPAGEGRYYLDRQTGVIHLQRGPCMFLPDPRKAVIVRRILEPHKAALYYPGNAEVIEYNKKMKALAELQASGTEGDYLPEAEYRSAAPEPKPGRERERVVGDSFQRGTSFTPPRTITIDSKYEGAVSISVWTGYAVLVVSKSGGRRVVQGPQTILLEYDESLEALYFSTGTPKTETNLEKSVYLRTKFNKISDLVTVETQDFCTVEISISYRVNFEGDPEKWFNVENYVKFLCDHMRSFLRNVAKSRKIADFYANAINIVRDSILGTSDEHQKRPGRLFEENGMRIYDVEVLGVTMENEFIESSLIDESHNVIHDTLALNRKQRELEFTKETESITRQIQQELTQTALEKIGLQMQEQQKQLSFSLAKIAATAKEKRDQNLALLEQSKQREQIAAVDNAIATAIADAELYKKRLEAALTKEMLEAEAEAVVKKAQAVAPELIAALQNFSDRELAGKMAQSMAPLAILGGKSVAEVLSQLLKGTAVEKALSAGDQK